MSGRRILEPDPEHRLELTRKVNGAAANLDLARARIHRALSELGTARAEYAKAVRELVEPSLELAAGLPQVPEIEALRIRLRVLEAEAAELETPASAGPLTDESGSLTERGERGGAW